MKRKMRTKKSREHGSFYRPQINQHFVRSWQKRNVFGGRKLMNVNIHFRRASVKGLKCSSASVARTERNRRRAG